MYKEAFASKLKKAREKTGFTQRDVQKETGISQSLIARYETGVLEPSVETLGILVDFYEVDMNWIYGTKGGPSEYNFQHIRDDYREEKRGRKKNPGNVNRPKIREAVGE